MMDGEVDRRVRKGRKGSEGKKEETEKEESNVEEREVERNAEHFYPQHILDDSQISYKH